MTHVAVRGETVAAFALLLLSQGLLGGFPTSDVGSSDPTDQAVLQTDADGLSPSVTVDDVPLTPPFRSTAQDLTVTEIPSTVVRSLRTLAGHVGWSPAVALAAYSRYDEWDAFENDNRRAVFAAVTSAPGTYVAEIAARLDLTASTFRYHLRVLEGEGLLRTEHVPGKRRVLSPQTGDIGLAAALNDEATAALLVAVYRRGAADVTELAGPIDRAPNTVSHHLGRLESAGLVDRQRDGQTVHVSLPSGVIESMEAMI